MIFSRFLSLLFYHCCLRSYRYDLHTVPEGNLFPFIIYIYIIIHKGHHFYPALLTSLWVKFRPNFTKSSAFLLLTHFSFLFFLLFLFFFFFLSFCLFAFSRATPVAYGGSQARGLIGAVATSLRQSHSNARSKPRLRPTALLTATPDP